MISKKRFQVKLLLASVTLIVFVTSVLVMIGPAGAAAPSSHPEFKLTIISATTGQPQFILSQALAEMINKDHPWLRASNRASLGWIDNVKTLARNTNMRKDTMIIADQASQLPASKGEEPFKGFQYTSGKIIAVVSQMSLIIVTLDTKIKTWRDLKGKRVNGAQMESMLWYTIKTIAEKGWGPDALKEMKIEHLTAARAKETLMDRLIDASIMAMSSAGPSWVASPHLKEMTAGHPVYGVDWGENAIETANSKLGFPIMTPVAVPPGAYGLSNKEPHRAGLGTAMWMADEALPEEVGYEIAKAIYDNIGRFGEYHAIGKLMTQELLTDIPVSETSWHPGALRFYKEKGLKIKK
jgi:hypothetical protein